MAWIEPVLFWGCVAATIGCIALWGYLAFTSPHSAILRIEVGRGI